MYFDSLNIDLYHAKSDMEKINKESTSSWLDIDVQMFFIIYQVYGHFLFLQ